VDFSRWGAVRFDAVNQSTGQTHVVWFVETPVPPTALGGEYTRIWSCEGDDYPASVNDRINEAFAKRGRCTFSLTVGSALRRC
jgi:hypothetical protein